MITLIAMRFLILNPCFFVIFKKVSVIFFDEIFSPQGFEDLLHIIPIYLDLKMEMFEFSLPLSFDQFFLLAYYISANKDQRENCFLIKLSRYVPIFLSYKIKLVILLVY